MVVFDVKMYEKFKNVSLTSVNVILPSQKWLLSRVPSYFYTNFDQKFIFVKIHLKITKIILLVTNQIFVVYCLSQNASSKNKCKNLLRNLNNIHYEPCYAVHPPLLESNTLTDYCTLIFYTIHIKSTYITVLMPIKGHYINYIKYFLDKSVKTKQPNTNQSVR